MYTRLPIPLVAVGLLSLGCLSETRTGAAPASPSSPAAPLRIHFLDVGQGDAAWVQVPGGGNLLVDGGPSGAGPRVIAALKAGGVTRLDWVVGSHPHEDHIGGLVDVLRELPVSQALDPAYNHGTALQRTYLELFKTKSIKANRARAGQTFELGGGTRLEILAPREPLLTNTKADANNNSIVMRLVHGETRVIFTGDMENAERERLLKEAKPEQLRSQVLKVSHHGSHNGTDPAFLRAVAPDYAVISLGKGNDYGHPHRETLDELASANVRVLRTDEAGTIVFESNGATIRPIGNPADTKTVTTPPSMGPLKGEVIANRNSKVYHRPDCASRPSAANQVKLSSAAQADKEGYRPHKACINGR